MDVSQIYHEKQEEGSMLCAQHALNNLLQTSLFSSSELANIAQELDVLEAATLDPDEALQDRHQNADDSGYFSVAVLEKALEVVGLRLVNWASEEMVPYHDFPEQQEAFVMNLQQHWFTIRRFGNNADLFFNLNSFLPKPDRVSKLYLGMSIHQAQREGYQVFAIQPTDGIPSSSDFQSFLPHSPADDYFLSNAHLAYTSFTPTSATQPPTSASSSRARTRSESGESEDEHRATRRRRFQSPPKPPPTLEEARPSALDEEEMLRLALKASLEDVQENGGSSTIEDEDDEVIEEAEPQSEDSFVEDEPSVEEMRRRRLARFGG